MHLMVVELIFVWCVNPARLLASPYSYVLGDCRVDVCLVFGSNKVECKPIFIYVWWALSQQNDRVYFLLGTRNIDFVPRMSGCYS